MKTAIPFNKKAIKATIIVPASEEQKYRSVFTSDGASVTEEITAKDRGDNKHVFIVKDLDVEIINMLRARDKTLVHYYELLLNTEVVKACFWMECRNVERVNIKFLLGHNEKGDEKWKEPVTIYSRKKDIMDEKPVKYEINWGGMGSVETHIAWKFEQAIHMSCVLTDELNASLKK